MIAQLLKTRPAHTNPGVIPQGKDDSRLQTDNQKTHDLGFDGLWRSPGGSLYVFDGSSFVCVSIHSGRFVGWLNKVAVKDICRLGDRWAGKQAFRNPETGTLPYWIDITLELQGDKVFKYFPAYTPGDTLIHGHIETYTRINGI